MNSLVNLSEIVHRCRKDVSKEYISEAIICYEAGAIRSAIVATWIGVFFDIVDKIRELSFAGDSAAESLIAKLDNARENENIQGMLAFERSVLKEAKEQIQLFGEAEYLSLSRIQEDRNLCAHPSFDNSGEIFAPPAELARVHIVNAVSLLMQFPPTSGKAALEKVITVIDSDLFPNQVDKARLALEKTGLGHPRASLLRSTILILLKSYLREKRSWSYSVALKALLQMHRTEFLRVLEAEISNQIRSLQDDQLSSAIFCLENLPDAVQWVEADIIERLSNFVSRLPGEEIFLLELALTIEPLNASAKKRVARLTFDDITENLIFDLIPEFRAQLIALLQKANTFEDSNRLCDYIQQNLGSFTEAERRQILEIGANNEQVLHSFSFQRLNKQLEETD